MPAVISPLYARFEGFYERWGALIQLVFGAVVVVISVVVAVIAISLAAQHSREATAVRIGCERSQQFGPALATFFERTQHDLGFEAISQQALEHYRATIPAHCPSR